MCFRRCKSMLLITADCRFPFVIRPKPCYLMDHRNWHRMGPRILEAVSGNYAAVLSLIWASLRG